MFAIFEIVTTYWRTNDAPMGTLTYKRVQADISHYNK